MRETWNTTMDGGPKPDAIQRFQQAAGDVFLITQLRPDEEMIPQRFASMSQLERMGKTPEIGQYEVTYYAGLPSHLRDLPRTWILEELYVDFNLRRPKDFTGHSLSVSDVVVLKESGQISAHYVDSIGFKELKDFWKEPERSSVLSQLKEKQTEPKPAKGMKARDSHEL